MLPATPNPFVLAWFDWYCRYALRKHFHRVHLYRDERAPAEGAFDPAVPRLYVANHVSFWDGILLNFYLRRFRPQPLYCMVDAVQVAEHPFFRNIGAFSVDRTDARDGLASIAYAAGLLNNAAAPPAVVVFPQGKILPNTVESLRLESGVARLVERVPGLRVVPIALRYEFWVEQRAEAMLWVGAAAELSQSPRRETLDVIVTGLRRGMTALQEAGRSFCAGDLLLQGRRSVSRWREGLPFGRR